MILKQLKQLALSATRRNAHLLRLPRLYTSPTAAAAAAASQTLTTTTSKPSKRLSRDDRRLVVESFVSKYRAANAGKFPTLKATVREVGGGYHVVRNILQELKLSPNAPISQLPNDDASSLKQEDHSIESSHSSSDEVSLQGDNNSLVIHATDDGSETVTASLDKDVDSKCDGSSSTHLPDTEQPISQLPASVANDASQLQKDDHTIESSHDEVSLRGDNSVEVPATPERSETVTAPPLDKDVDSKCDSSSTHLPESQTMLVETEEEGTLAQIAGQEPRADHLQGANVLTTEATATEFVSPEPKADHLEGASVLTATHGNRETETAPSDDDADSKCDATTHLHGSQMSKVSEECIKKSEAEEVGILTHLSSQEPKAEGCRHEGGAASPSVLPTETRQVPEKGDGEAKTGESSSAWSNIISFAKGFANFWRKG